MGKLRTQALEDYDSDAHGLECKDPSLAQQNQKEDADINVIVKRMRIGIPPPMTERLPLQGEFEAVNNFHDAMNLVVQAQTAFNQVPAAIRARFDNDPGKFLDFVEDPANAKELVHLGLAVARPQEAPKEGVEPKKRDSEPLEK